VTRRTNWPFSADVEGLVLQMFMLARRHALLGIREHRFHSERRWRFDCAIPELKLAVEYQGGLYMARRGGHQTAKGMRNDWEKFNEAQIAGWTVLLFGPDETRSGEAMNVIERAIKAREGR
jgi:hypothetical protein